jgi:polyhydroxyalkanoate synthesis regulator phasin
MLEPDPAPVFDALRVARERGLMPTSLGTAELRELGARILARAVFTARGSNAIFVSKLKEVIDQLAAGEINEASARKVLIETLRAVGYTPEGGFPDAPAGEVPPALEGTLQDLSSGRRLDLIVRTQRDLMRGAGLQYRGHTPDRLEAAPAWEFVRVMPVRAERPWHPRHEGKSRWLIVGGRVYGGEAQPDGSTKGGRMIALKGDPIWGELGSTGNFNDALDVDHPPFAFNSGMGWREVPRAECLALGVVGPDGQSIDEFHRGADRPRVLAGELPMPSPSLSMKDVDPDLLKQFREETKATDSKRKPGVVDYSDLLEEALSARTASYAERGRK